MIILFILITYLLTVYGYCEEKIDLGHLGLKGLRHCFKSMMTALALASNPLTADLERNLAAALASTFPRITNKK